MNEPLADGEFEEGRKNQVIFYARHFSRKAKRLLVENGMTCFWCSSGMVCIYKHEIRNGLDPFPDNHITLDHWFGAKDPRRKGISVLAVWACNLCNQRRAKLQSSVHNFFNPELFPGYDPTVIPQVTWKPANPHRLRRKRNKKKNKGL